MDFSADPTVGGGLDVFYDSSILSFVDFSFNSTVWGDDLFYRNSPTDLGGELDNLSFGNFAGISGPALVGTFTFGTIGTGLTSLSMAATDNMASGPFYSASTFMVQVVTFEGATVNVSGAAPVPEPATISLLLIGGAGLFGFSKKRKKSGNS